MMSVFIIAQLKFTEIERYRKYQAAFPAVFKKFNGRHVVSDENVSVLEGEWPYNKVVVLEFPTIEEATSFQNSPEYADIARDRKAGANATVIVAQGKG